MEKLKILHMYPNMLDLYGDSGNVEVLSYRCKMRGIELEVSKHLIGDKETDFTQYDIIYLGGGADFEQQILMGQYYKDSNGEKVPGLGLFDYYTVASTDKRCRCIGNIVIEAQLDGEKYKVIGFENHGGQTTNVKSPFGKVLSGNGNEFESSTEGYMEKSVIATYLHGPLLSKNPKVSDYVISYCMSHKLGEKYIPAPINDKLEEDCRKQLFERLGV